jgi:hypothetical protein
MIPLKVRRVWQTRRYAVGILVCFCALGLAPAGYGQTDRVSQLIDELKDTDSDARRNAALELGKIKDPRAAEPLIAALHDASPYVRMNAVEALEALGKIDDPRAVEPLIADLNNRDSQVRQMAAEALGKINDPRAVEALSATRNDTVADVHKSASAGDHKAYAGAALPRDRVASPDRWNRWKKIGGRTPYVDPALPRDRVAVLQFGSALATVVDEKSAPIHPERDGLFHWVLVKDRSIELLPGVHTIHFLPRYIGGFTTDTGIVRDLTVEAGKTYSAEAIIYSSYCPTLRVCEVRWGLEIKEVH